MKTYTKVDKIVSPHVGITSASNHQLTTTLFLPISLSIPPPSVLWNLQIFKGRNSEAGRPWMCTGNYSLIKTQIRIKGNQGTVGTNAQRNEREWYLGENVK